MSTSTQILVLLGAALFTSPAFAAPPQAAPADSAQYVSAIDNPWFPLKPGTILIYNGTKDKKRADREFEVTAKTKLIAGVTCRIVEDRVNLGGNPAEKTIGYYAQDKDGNVWYFGEESQELDKKGKVTKSEGWLAGVDGATASLQMEAHPQAGDHYVHPYTNGNTEIMKLKVSVQVPYGSFNDALQIKDWNPDQADVLSHKFYLKGVGEIRDVEVKEQSEDLMLVKVKTSN